MVADIGDHYGIFTDREQGVDPWFTVGIVSIEKVHGSGDEHVVEDL